MLSLHYSKFAIAKLILQEAESFATRRMEGSASYKQIVVPAQHVEDDSDAIHCDQKGQSKRPFFDEVYNNELQRLR